MPVVTTLGNQFIASTIALQELSMLGSSLARPDLIAGGWSLSMPRAAHQTVSQV